MNFYTYDYITAHSQFGDNVWYALSFLALAALLFVSVKHLRNRLATRYRDLEDLGVPVQKIRTNSTYLKQGMLVDVQGTFYTVTFNADFTSFQYERTHLLNRDVKIVDKED